MTKANTAGKSKSLDRRVVKTRKAIRDALKSLVVTKGVKGLASVPLPVKPILIAKRFICITNLLMI